MIKKNKNILINIIMIIFIVLFIYSSFKIIMWKIDNNKTINQLKNINEIVEIKESNNDPIIIEQKIEIEKTNPYWDYIKYSLMDVDLNKLTNINNDVVGWITVSGTNINYPFVKTKDNSFYLNHSFDKSYNTGGWVFLDYRNNVDELDGNTIIYAHERSDNSLFGTLKRSLNDSWYKDYNNHIVKMSTKKENTLWQVFSVYTIPNTDDYIKFNLNEDFIKLIKKRSKHNFNTDVDISDKIITLSTCYGNDFKMVMHAKLIKKELK